jgi:hypothetical protein
MVFDALKTGGAKVVEQLVPPGTPDNPRWKYDATVSISLVMIMTVGGAFMACGLGLLTFIGWDGFVKADDFALTQRQLNWKIEQTAREAKARSDTIQKQENDITFLLVKSGLKTAMKDLCNAERTGNQAALDSANTDLEGLEEQYHTLTGYTFNPPDCKTVLVDSPTVKPK